jgi:hypothetical protein
MVDFGADLIGFGAVKLIEDGQGLLVGVTGGLRIAGRVPGVAEVREGVGFEVAVTGNPVQVDGLLVADDRLGVVAKVMVGVAEAVPGVGLPVAVVELLEQAEGLFTGGERRLVVAELDMHPANRVQGVGLPALVAGGPVQVQGLPGVMEASSGRPRRSQSSARR